MDWTLRFRVLGFVVGQIWGLAKGWYMRKRLGISTTWIFRDGDALRIASRPKDFLRSGHKTYALWLSGVGILPELVKMGKLNVEILVLPHPETDRINLLDTQPLQSESVRARIIRMTRIALNVGLDVRWHRGWEGLALTLFDPEQVKKAAVHIEPIVPYLASGNGRPIIRIRGRKNASAIESYWKAFKRIAADSERVTSDDPLLGGNG